MRWTIGCAKCATRRVAFKKNPLLLLLLLLLFVVWLFLLLLLPLFLFLDSFSRPALLLHS